MWLKMPLTWYSLMSEYCTASSLGRRRSDPSPSNFDSIRAAVEEGRRVFTNIKRFVLHLLAVNIAEVVVLVVGLAFTDETKHAVFPLSPLAVLWLNMVCSCSRAIVMRECLPVNSAT